MKIEFLDYTGKKTEGKLTLKQVHANHPYRHFKYGKGLHLQIGKQIPEKIANLLARSYKDQFKIVEVDVDDLEVFKEELQAFLLNYTTIDQAARAQATLEAISTYEVIHKGKVSVPDAFADALEVLVESFSEELDEKYIAQACAKYAGGAIQDEPEKETPEARRKKAKERARIAKGKAKEG